MRVEAINTDKGLLIPLIGYLRKFKKKKILIDFKIVDSDSKKKSADDIDEFFSDYNINMKKFRFDRDEANEK